MTQPLTSAQQAQQRNRNSDGKYKTKSHSEAQGALLPEGTPGISQWVSEVGRYHQSIVENANWPAALTDTVSINEDDGSLITQTTFRTKPGDDENKVMVWNRHYHERYGAEAKDARLTSATALHQHGEEPRLFGGFEDDMHSQDAFRTTVSDTLDILRDDTLSDRQAVSQQRYRLNEHISKGRESLDASQHVADLLEVHDLYDKLRDRGVHKVELTRDDGPHYEIRHIDTEHEDPDLLLMEDAVIESGIPWQALRRADTSGQALMGYVVLDVTSDPGGISRAELEDQVRAINAHQDGPAHDMDPGQLTALNDKVTASLSEMGWVADTEDDYDRLNELTHDIADLLEKHRLNG
ncbi:MAG: hypothetical protein HLX51_00990 [Micrococcaceae bacterium]|nr:hypothetical protein [Micrococcaceae bacterium]